MSDAATAQLVLCDATLHVRATRFVDRSFVVGEHIADELGDFVVMLIYSQGAFTQYRAVRRAAWDQALQAFRDDPRSAMDDAMSHVWEYLDSTGGRGQPEPPADPRFDATFKSEDEAEDGERIGPLIVHDSVSGDVVWKSSEWVRVSEARALAEAKGWGFFADGCG